uniref:Ral transcription factor IIIC subunit 5 n=1 Tax=Salmo trutta TaxID=8032 RepID=A0A674A7T8_SALTR
PPVCHAHSLSRTSSNSAPSRVSGNSAPSRVSGNSAPCNSILLIVAGVTDFQYLAVHSAKDGSHTSLYDKIILRKPENNEFFEQPVPLFLPPPIFSRLDCHCPPTVSRDNLIGLSRARRPHNAIFLTFNDQNIPTEPLEAAKVNWKRVCVHSSDIKAEEQLKEMFESLPIWSRYAVKANLDIHPDKLKLLLPIVAYYMVRRPRPVRFDYDTRGQRIPGAVPRYTINDMPVKAKRSTFNYTLPITLNKAVPQAANVTDLPPEGPASGHSDSSYIFRYGTLPPHRQMFYQLCDLDVESIRNVISRSDGQEEECDERDGWCLSHTSDDLRDIMSSMIKQVIRAKRPGETSLSNTGAAFTYHRPGKV